MKIFLSYSHNDLDIKRKIKKSFENLKNENLIINIWDDENIRAGDKFDKKIFENLTDSDIAIFLISHNFRKSWYISKIEIPIAIKFNEKYGYPKIVPLIIDKNSLNEIYFPELTKFAPIPEKDKKLIPFKEFSKENEALEVIKENIKDIIYSGEFPEQREELDYFIFNKIYGKTKNAVLKGVQREKLQDLKHWLKEDNNIAVIEGEEGIGKSILAHQFGNFAWENNNFAIFLSSNIWKNFNSINDLFQYSFGIDIKYEDLDLFNNDYTIFILDGVNERNCIEVSQILIEDFNKTITDFQSKGIKLQIKLLFTTRKLNEYPSYINEIWKNIFKLNLEKYNEKEFNEAIKIYFKDLEIKDFPENIKELAKIPSYFEKTIQLKDRLISIKNLDKTILFWEKLKWQIENDADFKNKIKLTSINDLEYRLSKFIDKQINTTKIEKELLENIFGERFENIKQPLKDGRIVQKESSNTVTINEILLEISYITYLMAKLKDFLLENKFDLKEVNEEIKRILEPIASDFIAEIPYKTYLFYSKENFENKDDILTALFYNWIENTNTEVAFEKLSLLAYNYLISFIKLLDLIETKIYLFRFSNLDEIMIKVLKYLWYYKKENFIELKNYLFDKNERDTKILKRKIAISSGYKKFEFLKNFQNIFKDDKSNLIFFEVSNLLRIIYDDSFYKEIKEENLDEIKFVFNNKDVLEKPLEASHLWGSTRGVFARLRDIKIRNDFSDFNEISILPCILKDKKLQISFINQIEKFLTNNIENISNTYFIEGILFLSHFAKKSLIKILKNKLNKLLDNVEKQNHKSLFHLVEYLNFVFLDDEKLAQKALKKFSLTKNIHIKNFLIEFNILQDLNQNEELLNKLIDDNFINFLTKPFNVFGAFYEKYKNFPVSKIENKFKWFWFKNFFVSYNKDTILLYLSILKSRKYKQLLKNFLLEKIRNEEDKSKSNISLFYFWLLKENFSLEEFIFDIFNFNKNIGDSKNFLKEYFKNHRYNFEFCELLIKNRNIFNNYTYEELKSFLGVELVGYVLIDRKKDLFLFLDDLKKMSNENLYSIMFLRLPIMTKIFEVYRDKMSIFIEETITNLINLRKSSGDIFFLYKSFEIDLLAIFYKISKDKAFEYYKEIFNFHPIYNTFSKILFNNYDEKKLLDFINLVKNDFDIMWLTIMFLKFKKEKLLFKYLENFLKSKSSYQRQFAISFLKWFGDEEILKLLENIMKNDKSGYVRYFAEFSYYICLKEKNFKELFKDAINEDNLTEFTIKLLKLKKCLSPVSWVVVENEYEQNKKKFENMSLQKNLFFQKFYDDLNEVLNSNKFEIFGQELNNYIAGIKIDKYLKTVLNIN